LIRQSLRAAFSANVPLRVKLVAFKAALQLHADALEKHNAAIRLLDERTAAVWKAYVDKIKYIQ
jgi:cysteine sulfinate desulfinase/cysteine desulfurase-like protein